MLAASGPCQWLRQTADQEHLKLFLKYAFSPGNWDKILSVLMLPFHPGSRLRLVGPIGLTIPVSLFLLGMIHFSVFVLESLSLFDEINFNGLHTRRRDRVAVYAVAAVVLDWHNLYQVAGLAGPLILPFTMSGVVVCTEKILLG